MQLKKAASGDSEKSGHEVDFLLSSNLFSLKIEALLAEVSLKFRKEILDKHLNSIREILCGNFLDGCVINENWVTAETNFPLHLQNDGGKVSLSFKSPSPSQVHVIGSCHHMTLTKPFFDLDIICRIPDDCLVDR